MAWPTTDNPRKNFVTLRLTDDEAADLDWLAVQMGSASRSDAIRTAFERVVAAEKRKKARVKTGGKTPGPRVLAGADDD